MKSEGGQGKDEQNTEYITKKTLAQFYLDVVLF